MEAVVLHQTSNIIVCGKYQVPPTTDHLWVVAAPLFHHLISAVGAERMFCQPVFVFKGLSGWTEATEVTSCSYILYWTGTTRKSSLMLL